ncbi:MAG: hypothetical protein HY760_00515 [Nitrospirae bacterium]|nr:hypothetical protein [Nitrospirota bacterium]
MSTPWVNEDWIEDITLADLPKDYQWVAELISVRSAILLAEKGGGVYHYIPKLDKLLRQIRNKKILEEFNGSNHKELARKYGLSEIMIREIVGKKEDARNQPSLFAPDGG